MAHRFIKRIVPKASLEEEEFMRSMKKGTFAGYFERIWGLMQCRVGIHRSALMAGRRGYYWLCDKCMFYQRIDLLGRPIGKRQRK